MKIMFLITRCDEIGGAQIHIRDISESLTAEGHGVVILVGHGGDEQYRRRIRSIGVKYHEIQYLRREINLIRDLMSLVEIIKKMRKLKPNLLSTHSSKAGALGRIAGFWLRIPVLFTAHGWSFTEGVPHKHAFTYRLIEKIFAPLSARIINVSKYDKNLAKQYRVAKEPRLTVIHNGVEDIDPEFLANPKKKACNIVMIGRFASQKDHELLLRALSRLRDLNWSLRLIGTGAGQEKIKTLAGRLGLEDRIRFLGQINDVKKELAEAQIYVLVSKWEGLPRSIIEAMRAGLPVVATDVGGVNELIKDSINGYLVYRGNIDYLSGTLERLIRNPALRSKMGKEGRKIYRNGFIFEKMYNKTKAVYEEILF